MLPAVITAMQQLKNKEDNADAYNRQAYFIAITCVATIVLCALTVFAQYESPDYTYPAISPVFYLKMKCFFG